MLREAETCCDQQVIDRGFRGPEYARDIVELARSCEGRILLPSISSAIGRKSMLKERIKRVLSLKPGRRFGAGGVVRVLVICLACMVPILALSAQAKPADEPLFGAWVNEEYSTSKGGIAQKFVVYPDGRELYYGTILDEEPFWEEKIRIEDQWIDEEGNFWYAMSWEGWYSGYPGKSDPAYENKGFRLLRINSSGTTIEGIQAKSRIPDEEDWSLMPHGIWYKQE
jgi:hypothetical protein